MDPTPTILRHFESLRYAPPKGRFTVMAAFFLVGEDIDEDENRVKIIAMATGTKCLAKKNYSKLGDAVHDFHAEILSRRGAVRWFLREMARDTSEWLAATNEESGQRSWALRHGVTLNMYISELPCGDASTRAIARLQSIVDPHMASMKSQPSSLSTDGCKPHTNEILVRGREGYHLINRVRTKPGRGDAPTTNAMSCSDKIALWCGVGIQGALLISLGLAPIYINTITMGSVAGVDALSDITTNLQDDCRRAFAARLGNFSLEGGYKVHIPKVIFTAARFEHGRDVAVPERTSCNEAMCWIADEGVEVLVNGIRRGTLPKNRWLPALRTRVCKASLFALYQQTAIALSHTPLGGITTYYDAKHAAVPERTDGYHAARAGLRGIGGPLHGWLICDTDYDRFGIDT